MSEQIPPLQDRVTARDFEHVYSDFIERGTPRTLINELIADADAAADGSVLAASVVSHVAFDIEKGGHHNDPDAVKKQAIIDAKIAADAVVELDAFVRNPAHAHEPVVYALQEYEHPNDVPDFLKLHFSIAEGTTVQSRKAYGTKGTYYVEPKIQYGVASPIIAHGHALPHPPLDGTKAYDFSPEADNKKARTFNMMTASGYEEISRGALWPSAYRFPPFICGTDTLLETFTTIVNADYLEGYTEHRDRRASYLLLRQASYMGHAIAGTMFDIADQAGLVPVWQAQVADDYALKTVAKLEKLAQSDLTAAQFAERNFISLFNGGRPAMELETLAVTPDAIIARAHEHAARRKLAASAADIATIAEVILD